ncbi:MAG: PEFG-CTERM sorting domain-containing protein [Nitrosarchaeum sp.]
MNFTYFGLVMMVFALFFVSSHDAFGHGLGGETIPVIIGDRDTTLSIGIQPTTFDPKNNESYFTIKLTDQKTDAVIEHVTFNVELIKNEKQIFKETFHDDLGNLNIRVISKDSDKIKIDGDKESNSGGWTKKFFSPLTMEGPIFTSGGLYKFHIEIITIDSDQNFLSDKPVINGAISITEKTNHSVIGTDGKNYNIGFTSYYDQIHNFAYDSKNNIISFDMPFDWSKQNINQTSVVHQEIHIPKTFAEMLVTKYDVILNDKLLDDSSATIDDYSEDARIIHLVLNQKKLLEIADGEIEPKMHFSVMPSKQVKFPLQANTGNGEFLVGLSWDPPIINPDQNIVFDIVFDELFSNKKPKPVTYDFIIKQNGNDIFKKKSTGQANSPTLTNLEEYVFSSDNLGPVVISLENINDNDYAKVSFVAVVKQTEKQTFPIRLASEINESGIIKDGKYFVDLTWFPSELTTEEESEFVITIYDKQTLIPIKQVEYDLVIIQNGNEIFRKSNLAPSGGSFVDFKFSESNVGPAILRIENIEKSHEYVEIPIIVTPEFGIFAMIILSVALVSIIGLTARSRLSIRV